MRLFIVSQDPFSALTASRIDQEELNRHSIEVVILDATDLLLPSFRVLDVRSGEGFDVINLADSQDVQDVVRQLSRQDVILFLGGVFGQQPLKVSSLYRLLSGSRARVSAINSGHIPLHLGSPFPRGIPVWRERSRTALARVARPHSIPGEVRSLAAEAKNTGIAKWRARTSGSNISAEMKTLDALWTGTQIEPISRPLIGESTRVRYIHTFDYEKMGRWIGHQPSDRNSLVVLDCLGPVHPDYGPIERSQYNLGVDEYFGELVHFVIRISAITGLEPIVSAHPKAIPGSLDSKYGPLSVRYGETDRLVAESALVVDPNGSAAIGMAAVMRCPVVFVNSRRYGMRVWKVQNNLSRWLGMPMVDIASDLGGFTIPRVETSLYDGYVQEFVKRVDSVDEPLWRQIAQDLEQGW